MYRIKKKKLNITNGKYKKAICFPRKGDPLCEALKKDLVCLGVFAFVIQMMFV